MLNVNKKSKDISVQDRGILMAKKRLRLLMIVVAQVHHCHAK
jgi:hypothetical protein